ncbi:molybdopterin-dependent oxidoreductase [Streptomyces sp. NPDC002073]|uniref:molybdopterin-dependent oxidoreductase n=1 Tax=Streptomyces sp. NBC_00239 TaxID=2903640 RepID=UPI002E2D0E65|nr:molybdopterin-dependent oxidoreductase [Streptomyces sp. NBC_00239]
MDDGSGQRARRTWFGALSGLIAGFAGLCLAELASAVVRPQSGPVTAVGGAVIDATPTVVKEWAVQVFGTADKLVLQLGILVLLAAFAAAAGVLAVRRPPAGVLTALLFGLFGAVAAVGRPEGRAADAVPSAVAGLTAAAVLYLLAVRVRAGYTGPGSAPDRRRFIHVAAGTVVLSGLAGLVGRQVNASGAAEAEADRSALRLPPPASPAEPVPPGADLRIRQLSPFITPNRDFYRVDTALVVPKTRASDWSLTLHGEGVARPLTLDYDALLRRELIERDITLACVSNEVGGPYVGNARWLGVRLADLLREAGVRPPSQGGPADQLVARSVDGMTLGTPVETVMDGRDALLAVGMNGEPLPFAHGFPVRMVVPGLYGYVSACKWLRELRLTTFEAYDAYWVKRSWAARAPVKTQSRIDTPRSFAKPKAGRVAVAGVAWAQHRGISKVEVRVDGGAWREARLAAADTVDTWRQWVWEWEAAEGRHELQVRATDGTGRTQTGRRAGTVPDGATGWHTVVVNVS